VRGTTDLRIRLTDLRRHPGERATVAGPVDLDGVSVTSAEVAPGTQGELHAVLESLSDGVTVSGTVEFSWTGDCRRCLEGTSGTAVADIHEVFKDRPDDPNGDLRPVDGDVVDLEPAVREAVILSLPLAPLSRPRALPGDHRRPRRRAAGRPALGRPRRTRLRRSHRERSLRPFGRSGYVPPGTTRYHVPSAIFADPSVPTSGSNRERQYRPMRAHRRAENQWLSPRRRRPSRRAAVVAPRTGP
jgi:uncharacterized protein